MKIKLIDFGLEKDHYPFRPHENDAGADVYMPYDCTLKPGEIARIPLGFGLMIPDGYAGYVFPRSSMAAKGLVCELPPIDSGYRGEIHAIISNVSSESQILRKDTRVGQLVITPVLIADFVLDLGESLVMKSLLKWLKYFTYQSMSSPFQYYLNQENMMLRPSGCMNFLQNYNFFNKIKKAGNL